MPCWPSAPAWCLHPTSFFCVRDLGVVVDQDLSLASRNERELLSSSPSSSCPALIDNRHCSRPSSGSYSQSPGLLQWRVCRSASGSVQPPPVCISGRCATRPRLGRAPVMSAIRDTLHWLGCPQRVTLNAAWQPTNACMASQHLTSPGSAHRSPPSPAAHTCVLPINTNGSCPARLPRRSVHGHSAHCLRTLFPRSFVTQPSPSTSSDNTWKLIFSTIIVIDFVFHSTPCTVFLGSVTARAFETVSV